MRAMALVAIILVGVGHAEGSASSRFEVGVLGGGSYLLGGAINDDLNGIAGLWNSLGWSATTTELRNSYGGGVEMQWKLGTDPSFSRNRLSLGFRGGYWKTNTGETSAHESSLFDELDASGAVIGHMVIEEDISKKYDVTFIPVEIGGKVFFPIGGRIRINCGVFAGVGFADVDMVVERANYSMHPATVSTVSPSTNSGHNVSLSAIGPILDGVVGVEYLLSRHLAIGFDMGFRYFSSPLESDGDYLMEKDYTLAAPWTPASKTSKVTADMTGVVGTIRAAYLF